MDPITLIVIALKTGVTLIAKQTASEAIKDAYQALKERIQSKFADKPDAELVLAKHQEKPDVWEVPLKDALTEAAANRDEEIIKAAQKLMTLVNPHQAARGKYNVQITGNVQGLVQGDNVQVTMTFGDEPPKKEK